MKKLLFLLMMPILCYGQYKPLSQSEIKEKYPNTVCTYYDNDFNSLFNGSGYDKNHPDASLVHEYICNNFSGDFFMSSCYEEHLRVDNVGNLTPLYDQIKTESRKVVARFYWSENGKLNKTICWNENGEEIDCSN